MPFSDKLKRNGFENRVIINNIANALTILRLLLLPVIFQLIINGSIWAFVVFGVAALTDMLDGQMARRTNRVTEFGKLLDPFVDRLFISGVVVALFLKQAQPPLWAIVTLLSRDLIILIGSAWLKLQGHEIDVTFLGKSATATLSVAIFLMVAGLGFGIWVFYLGLVLYLGSGFDYLARGKNLVYSISRK